MEVSTEDKSSLHIDINNLLIAKQGIESEKITERKKSASCLKELLERSHVLDYIHVQSQQSMEGGRAGASRGQMGAITWSSLFKSIASYILKEAEGILKLEEKATTSAIAFTNRVTKKKDVAEMLRVFIRASNKKGSLLPLGEVLNHIRAVLDNRKMKEWAAMDYTHILMVHILSVPHYILNISATQWEDLLALYCDMYFSSMHSLDKPLVARAIHTILTHSATQCDLSLHGLYLFFSKAFANISEEKDYKLLEELLGGLCKYFTLAGPNGRSRLCCLGEDILPSILHLWARSPNSLKDQIVELVRIQIRVHHPGGRLSDEEGAWARSDSAWKGSIEKLYELVLNEFETSSSRLRRPAGWSMSEGAVGHGFGFLDLACDVVYITMHWNTLQANSSTPRAKRRKTQSCWATLRDGVSSSKDVPSTISWLQLIAWLLSKWSASLPSQEHLPLLTLLQKMLREQESKRGDCAKWVLISLCALALNPTTAKEANSQAQQLWKKICHSIIKLLTVHCGENEGYSLLSILVTQQLAEPDPALWQLFNGTFNSPTSYNVSFLVCVLGNYPLPESIGQGLPPPPVATPFCPPTTHNGGGSDNIEALAVSSYPVRSQLLSFLLPGNLLEVNRGTLPVGRDAGSHDLGKHPVAALKLATCSASPPPVVLMSHMLVALIQRSHSYAQLPFLKHFYQHSSPSFFLRELLDPSFISTHRTRILSDPFSPVASMPKGDFISKWEVIEKIFLQSTFDNPLVVPCLEATSENESEPKTSQEITIGCLQSLLLHLLGRRSEMLLQPLGSGILPSSRERSQQLGNLLELQASHCCLILHTTLLLCQCEAFTQLDQLRKPLAIRTLPQLLKRIEVFLCDPVWNEIERVYYFQTCSRLLSSLLPLISFPHLQGPLPPPMEKALLVVRKLCAISLPDSLLEKILTLAEGKWPIPVAATFNLGGGESTRSTPRSRSESRGVSVDFDDDEDMADSGTSSHSSNFSATSCIGAQDLLSVSSLDDKSSCQVQAAHFLCHVYINWSIIHSTEDVTVVGEGVAGKKFDIKRTLISLLSEHDKSKATNLQIVFKISEKLCEDERSLHQVDMLECVVDVLSEVLSVHRKNQTVYSEGLALLGSLLPHLCNADPEIRKNHIAVVSGFWTLYKDKLLPAAVRLKLVDLLSSLYAVDRENTWSSLTQRKKKKQRSESLGPHIVSARQALVAMVNDGDHAVRMHVARAITNLFIARFRSRSSERRVSESSGVLSMSRQRIVLLSCKEQEETFQKVLEMLQPAFIVSDGLDELSTEDESVNRVASRIYTLQMEGCVSPVCERKVVSELILAMGHGHIDPDLVAKALYQLAVYHGFKRSRELLEMMLPSLVHSWQAMGFPFVDFPHKLMGWDSTQEFFRAYSDQLIPHLVFNADETTLTTISDMLDCPLPALLKASLPSCMVLIVTCWAQREDKEGKREQASASNKFLLKHVSKEAIDQTLHLTLDTFTIELLVRMFEPHTAKTHLAPFSLPSDPEPSPPHYTSQMIQATLDYMPTCYSSSASTMSFITMLSRRNEHIQHVLLSLAVKIEATHRPFEKRRLLMAYNLFVRLICKELREGGLEGLCPFIIMDVVHMLVRILSREGKDDSGAISPTMEELFPSATDVLETLCGAVLEGCPRQLNPHLPTIVATLIPYARHIKTTYGKKALTVLSNLIEKVSPEAIVRLDPFPDIEPFTRLHNRQMQLCKDGISLVERIDQFLSGGKHSVRTEGLKFLQKSLRASKYEIPHLLKQGSSGPLLRLLCVLVDLCSTHPLPAVAASHVAHVLGEIGPRDLSCIALPAIKEGVFDVDALPKSWVPKTVSSVKLLHFLAMLLLDKDISVVQASGECLREVLASKTGSALMSRVEEEVTDLDIQQWYHYLQPFKPQRKKKPSAAAASLPSPSSFISWVDVPEVWLPVRNDPTHQKNSHSEWLTKLVDTLLSSGGVSDEVLFLVRPVCMIKVELCEEIFPLIIHDILLSNKDEFRSVLSQQVRLFFHTVNAMPRPSSPSSMSTGTSAVPSDSIRTMLNMVMYLRTVDKPKQSRGGFTSTPWDNNFWLDLDFLDVARAAQRCSAYFTSLLYIEIWRGTAQGHSSHSRGRLESSSDSADDEVIILEQDIMSVDGAQENDTDVQALLLDAYKHIGEPDSLYGACSTHANNDSTRLWLCEHEGEWHKSLSTHNILMEVPGASNHVNIAESLLQLGLSHVLKMYLCGVRSVEGEDVGRQEVGEYLYETAWRCTRWDKDSCNAGMGLGARKEGYHQSVFNCIMSLKDGEVNSIQTSLYEARCHVIGSLCSTGLESTYGLYPSLSKFLCLLEMEEACTMSCDHGTTDHSLHNLPFLQNWQERLSHLNSDFQFVEPVLALRGSVLHCLLQVSAAEMRREGSVSVEQKRTVESIFKALSETLLTHSRWAREATNYQVSERALFSLKQLQHHQGALCVSPSLQSSLPWMLRLEEAKLHWDRGERTSAMALLNQLLEKMKTIHQSDPEVSTLYPTSLNLYGSWLAETRSESPSEIISEYLEKSVAIMEGLHNCEQESVIETYLTLARYADNQYRSIERHMESSAFEAKRQLLQKSKLELQKLESKMSLEERQRNRHVRTLQSQSEEDESVVSSLLNEKQLFLVKALKNYILCLRTGDAHDLRVFRLCGLWFANSTNFTINKIMEEGISQLESRKFIPLMYQLAARMSSKSQTRDTFQKVLQEVIHRSMLEHPYHCLFIILALSNASKDNQFPKSGYVTGVKNIGVSNTRLSRKTTATSSSFDEDKVKAAKDLIAKLRSKKASLIQSVEQLCDAYVDLAYYDVSAYKKQRGPVKLPNSCPLLKLSRGVVVVPTLELAVDKTCCYNDVVSINKFEPFFQLAGGVNLPKVITCIGSDGKRRKQLVKGRDDLRQDAVMQQIFILVNQLLQNEPATRKRKLCVRTYKVIPLSQRSGVVEWCEGTRPLGEYLIGTVPNPSIGAHSRYRPLDWTSLQCRKKMMEASNVTSGKSKSVAYTEITSNFRPVFHHFFMEHFPTPPQWFERSLAYTRSVAASSMVGYMVGLGDRHVQNILIDTLTAEFIHIDLGVAFEQGKTLPIPETVPFRLTRDIIDGMGIAGVEGVFRRCCEKTLSLMRVHQEELRTIVEVLLHDPLYQWTLSPLKAINLQYRPEHGEDTHHPGDIFETAQTAKGMNSDLNKMAERVLIRLQEKLEGIEDGVPLSVSGQVNHLIQEATDPNNLCILFPGWQPWI